VSDTPAILYLFDESETLRGVQLSAEVWEKVEHLVRPHLPSATPVEEPEPPEPLQDWETLTQYWDFKYPHDYDVACGACGQSTEDWRADDPRKFRLRNATLGGLVTFQCAACKARIMKRHFKDQIKTETQPFREQKDPKLNAVYGDKRQYFT